MTTKYVLVTTDNGESYEDYRESVDAIYKIETLSSTANISEDYETFSGEGEKLVDFINRWDKYFIREVITNFEQVNCNVQDKHGWE